MRSEYIQLDFQHATTGNKSQDFTERNLNEMYFIQRKGSLRDDGKIVKTYSSRLYPSELKSTSFGEVVRGVSLSFSIVHYCKPWTDMEGHRLWSLEYG